MIQHIRDDRLPLVLAAGSGIMIALFVVIGTPASSAAVVAAGIVLLVLFNRRAAMYLIIPFVALSPEIPLIGIPVRLEDLLMVPLAGGWLARLLVFKERRGTPLDRIMLAYFGVGLISTVWGAYLGTANLSSIDQLWSAPFHLLKRLEFLLLFLILVDTFVTPRDVQRLTYLAILSMVALNLFALTQFLSNSFLALAPTGAPVHEPGLASMVTVVLALSLWAAARLHTKFLLGAAILFSVATLPLGLGRNYFATTAMLILYIGVFQQRWVLGIVPLYLLVAPRLYPRHVIERILTFRYLFESDITGSQTQGAALISRTVAPTYYSLLALGYSPVFGFGLASQPIGFIDNEYVVQLFYTGLLGFVVFIILGSRLLRMAQSTRRSARTVLERRLAQGLQLTLAAYAIYSIFAPSISAARGGGLFFIVAGLVAVLHRSLHSKNTDTANSESA